MATTCFGSAKSPRLPVLNRSRSGLKRVLRHLVARDFDVPLRTSPAEVDGNRTRRTGIARPARFEGGEAHQAPGHLQTKGTT